MINIQNVSLLDILSPNLRKDPTISAAAKSIDEELREITAEISNLSLFDRLDELTDSEVNELAYQFHVDFYDPKLPIEQKRELVKKSIPFHRRKGTPSAVEELVSILFGEGRVEEWFEYGGNPFHFRVLTNNPEVTQGKAIEFYRAVESVKRLSARLERVILSQTEEMSLYVGCVLHTGEKMIIRQVS
ncbi:phage tail protein I [Paenibacillus larvae]|uniref:Tail protein n=1 Tax=Bacteriophage Lily TaxID=1589751 RepID=A0A0C5AJ63_9CAUD|nr:phage tail protein I [Paenibacillus larvae]YP_009202230.1 baseplate protein [Bacteriophage Lily]AJK27748.1 tail protein [Bacteriophage Lily]MCY9564623.1 phage tail protein I [Paenibacillus larvae]MCY9568353.1 phage tail protein I [Paenibacillus larvae]MCY9571693.1 phage tail protein I [Paenibacillus larvae]MCY9690622.1 phage tail protein I [Paenibacillus larvae]